jgi:hypothetical protein
MGADTGPRQEWASTSFSSVANFLSCASFENDKPEVTVLLSGIRFEFGLWLVENIFHFVLLLKNAFLFLICFV